MCKKTSFEDLCFRRKKLRQNLKFKNSKNSKNFFCIGTPKKTLSSYSAEAYRLQSRVASVINKFN